MRIAAERERGEKISCAILDRGERVEDTLVQYFGREVVHAVECNGGRRACARHRKSALVIGVEDVGACDQSPCITWSAFWRSV